MTTPAVTPKVTYNNVTEATLYNFNVPVASEPEIIVEFVDENGVDLLADITYELLISKSMGSLLFDTSTIEITWVGAGVIPATNTLTLFRKTSEIQQTVFEFRADLSVETAQEVDRLTRSQQDTNEKLDELDSAIENIGDNINPLIDTASLVDSAVTTDKINTAAVTEVKLADGSVVESKLGVGAVTNTKLGANAVTETKIQNNAVSIAKIQDNSISTVKLQDASITEAKLDNSIITSAKLAQDVLDRFDQNIPFKLSVSSVSNTRVRIESAEIALNDSSNISVSTGSSLIKFDGLEIDLVTGNTYDLVGTLIGTNTYDLPIPSANQYVTYLIEAKFQPVNSVGKTPLVLSIVGGQQAPILGNQVFPERSENKDLGLGYVTVQELGGSLAPLTNDKLITLENNTNKDTENIARIRVVSHTFTVGAKLIPVYWNGSAWVAANANNVTTLATHLILDVVSATEFTLAYNGRIYYPTHGLNVGAYYFLGNTSGVLSIIEAETYSNPLIQVENENYFTMLGWRANEKSVVTDVTGVDQILIPTLQSSTPTMFTTTLSLIYSIQVYDSTRVRVFDAIEIRIDDNNPNGFTLFTTSNWTDLRVDIVGVK